MKMFVFNSWRVYISTFVNSFLPWLTFIVLISILIYFIFMKLNKENKTKKSLIFSLIFGFSSLGSLIGFTTGASLTPVLGTVLPATLTVLGSVIGYIFSKDTIKDHRPIIATSFVVLLVSCMFNVFIGIAVKQNYLQYSRDYEVFLIDKKNELEIDKLQVLRDLELGSYSKKKDG